MILLRKDLGVLAEGVREGRRTFVNILKYMMMGTSSNFGNMFSMAGGVLFLPFLPMLPTQILLNNLLYDLSETTIPIDRVDDAMVAQPRRWDLALVRKFMVGFGPLSSIFDFITFGLLLWLFDADEKLFHTGWFVESLATQVLVIFIIRTVHPLQDRPHPALVVGLRRGCGASLFAACRLARLRSTPCQGPGGARARGHRLSFGGLRREALVLHALSARVSSGNDERLTRERPVVDFKKTPLAGCRFA